MKAASVETIKEWLARAYLKIKPKALDGNCMFRVLAFQIMQTEKNKIKRFVFKFTKIIVFTRKHGSSKARWANIASW